MLILHVGDSYTAEEWAEFPLRAPISAEKMIEL